MAAASDVVAQVGLSYTEASVVADALMALQHAVSRTGAQPWENYVGDAPDGPEAEGAYRAAISSAHAKCIAVIEAS